MSTRTENQLDYQVISAAGTVVYTSPIKGLAIRWAMRARLKDPPVPGLSIREVVRTYRTIWTDRLSLVASNSDQRRAS